jgi:hypothetical protein
MYADTSTRHNDEKASCYTVTGTVELMLSYRKVRLMIEMKG